MNTIKLLLSLLLMVSLLDNQVYGEKATTEQKKQLIKINHHELTTRLHNYLASLNEANSKMVETEIKTLGEADYNDFLVATKNFADFTSLLVKMLQTKFPQDLVLQNYLPMQALYTKLNSTGQYTPSKNDGFLHAITQILLNDYRKQLENSFKTISTTFTNFNEALNNDEREAEMALKNYKDSIQQIQKTNINAEKMVAVLDEKQKIADNQIDQYRQSQEAFNNLRNDYKPGFDALVARGLEKVDGREILDTRKKKFEGVDAHHSLANIQKLKQELEQLKRDEVAQRTGELSVTFTQLPCLQQFNYPGEGADCGFYAAYFATLFAQNSGDLSKRQKALFLDRKNYVKTILNPGKKIIEEERTRVAQANAELSDAELDQLLDEMIPMTYILGSQIKSIIPPKLHSDIIIIGDQDQDPYTTIKTVKEFKCGKRKQLVYILSPDGQRGTHWFAARIDRDAKKKLRIIYADSMNINREQDNGLLEIINDIKQSEA